MLFVTTIFHDKKPYTRIMSIRALGVIANTDDDADYYHGVERLSDRVSFGVYQPVTFRDPETGLVFVGKPH